MSRTLARQAAIKAQIGYGRRPGSYGGRSSVVVDNTLDRQFDVEAQDTVWVTDITYIRSLEGFAYLAVVIGWRISVAPEREAKIAATSKRIRGTDWHPLR